MKYYIVDSFTDKLFGGNPAGVCLLEAPLSDAVMQSIATENNLAETAFLLRQEEGYSLRWFTPEYEFDLCGHATLASAFILFKTVEQHRDMLHFSTQSGMLSVQKKGDLLEMNFPSRPPKEIPVLDIMARALGAPVLEAHLSRDMVLLLPDEKNGGGALARPGPGRPNPRMRQPDRDGQRRCGGFRLPLLHAGRQHPRGPGDRFRPRHADSLLGKAVAKEKTGGAAALKAGRNPLL